MNGKPQYSWTQSVTLGVLASSFLVGEWLLNRGSSKISITFSSNESFGNQYSRGTRAVAIGSLLAEYVPLATQTPSQGQFSLFCGQ